MNREIIIGQAVDDEIKRTDPLATETESAVFWQRAERLLKDYGSPDYRYARTLRTPNATLSELPSVALYVRGEDDPESPEQFLSLALMAEVIRDEGKSIIYVTFLAANGEDQPEEPKFEQLRRDADRIDLIRRRYERDGIKPNSSLVATS